MTKEKLVKFTNRYWKKSRNLSNGLWGKNCKYRQMDSKKKKKSEMCQMISEKILRISPNDFGKKIRNSSSNSGKKHIVHSIIALGECDNSVWPVVEIKSIAKFSALLTNW